MIRFRTIAIVAALASFTASAQENPDKLYSALRSGDLGALKALLDEGISPNTPDSRGVTPLMNATAVGSIDAMKLLIDRGADVNAQNAFGSTALMWSVSDPAKARLLLDHGADVSKTTKIGRTALMIAALNNHSADLVRLLLAKGANPSQKDSQGFTAFLSSIASNDMETIRLLADYAGNVNEPNGFTGFAPLMAAAGMGNIQLAKMLIAKGADVNGTSLHDNIPTFKVKNGTVALGAITPLMMSVTYGPPEMVKMLLDAGAKVNATDIRGMSPLMLAVTSDHQDPAIVKMLLDHGAETSVKSTAGETAIDWALKFGQSGTVGALGGRPTQTPRATAVAGVKQDARAALQRSVGLLETSSATFFVKSGCNACHAQGPAHFAVIAAKAKGIAVDEKLAAERIKQMLTAHPPGPIIMERPAGFAGGDAFFYALEALGRSGYPPSPTTDIMAAEIAAEQWEDGGWRGSFGLARTPLQDGNVSRTSMALRLLKNYGTPARASENKDRIQRAKQWLLNAKMVITEDYDMRLWGAAAAGSARDELAKLAEPILKRQRADGGWAQRDELSSDAYATGMTLSALVETGMLAPSSSAFKNGIQFLLSTQAPDGSWHVASRAAKFQPYFEGGFPYGHDQWISSNATAWAANALALGLERPPVAAQR